MKYRLFALLMLMVLAFVAVAPIAAQESEAETEAFPITIEHKFGSTTITELPERVVSIGFAEQDPLLALGIKPVAVRYWYGDTEDAIFPWAEDEGGEDYEPVVLNMAYGNLNYEAILALDPDFISAVDSGITAEEYEALSQIAPTLAQTDDYVDFGTPWQESTRLIASAFGKSEEAEALIEGIESQLAAVRQEYPQFEDLSIAVAYNNAGTYGFYTDQDVRGRFFAGLGFVVPEALNELAGDSFYFNLSTERLDLLDQDFLVFLGLQFSEDGSEAARAAIEADPILSQLDAVKEGRVLFIPDEFDDALQFSSVLSLNYLLENLVPEIAAVLED